MEDILKEYNIIKCEEIDGVKVVYVERLVNPLKKYYESHKEEISKKKSERFKDRYHNDEEYKNKMKERSRINYIKKKLKNESQSSAIIEKD